jgi:protein-S-isoprenylcysteine O-methyltransferase Ste14
LFFFVVGITGKKKWRQRGMATGFMIALFAEMWGFPLSIFVITSLVGSGGLPYQFDNLMYYFIKVRSPSDIAFTNMPLSFFLEYSLGRGITLLSVFPIIYGWFTLKKNIAFGLVTGGPYAFSRNPQYIGFILFTIGMVLYWPTLITIPMGCVLCVAYYRLARSEEKELRQTFKEKYSIYAEKVPRFIGKSLVNIFGLPRGLKIIEKITLFALLVPFVLWFAESLLGIFLGDAFVRAYWFPIAYFFPVHIGVFISISLIVPVCCFLIFKEIIRKRGKNRKD